MSVRLSQLPKDLPILNQKLGQLDQQAGEISDLKDSVTALRALPVMTGSGAPSGVVAAPVGTLYLRLDGATSATLYVKETGGAGVNGWVAK